jgi:hypothetical protein
VALLRHNGQFVAMGAVHLSPDTSGDLIVFEPDQDVSVERMQPRKHGVVIPREPDAGTVERDRFFGPPEDAGEEAPIGPSEGCAKPGADLLDRLSESANGRDGIFGDRQDNTIGGRDTGYRPDLAVPPGLAASW